MQEKGGKHRTSWSAEPRGILCMVFGCFFRIGMSIKNLYVQKLQFPLFVRFSSWLLSFPIKPLVKNLFEDKKPMQIQETSIVH